MTAGTDLSGPIQHADFQNAIKKMVFFVHLIIYFAMQCNKRAEMAGT